MKSLSRLLGGTVLFLVTVAASPPGERPSDSFRQEHQGIRAHLNHLSDLARQLPSLAPDAQVPAMKNIAAAFKEHIKPHAEWEERVLYPAIDRRAGGRRPPFTSTMRNDHRIVERWIDQLQQAASKGDSDAREFARNTDRLLGLLTAHFENEEEVLLPVLDKTMSKKEFEREIMRKAEH